MAKLRSEIRDAIKKSKALRESAKQEFKRCDIAAAIVSYAEAVSTCKAAIDKTQAMGTTKSTHGGYAALSI